MMKIKLLAALAGTFASISFCTMANATSYTIDFSTIAPGPITSSGIASFSLAGGPASGTPVVGYGFYDTVTSLNNSPNFGFNTNGYPTANIIDITFSSLVSNVSFTFNNYGSGNGTFYEALDAVNNVISSVNIDSVNSFANVLVSGSGIKTIEFNNGVGGNNWIYGVGSLSFSTAAPEISTWAMMLVGFAGLGFASYRASRKTATVAV